jgi:hypothetical protein
MMTRKEEIMDIEHTAVSIVSEVVHYSDSEYVCKFCNGTMFVECTAAEAAEIETRLIEALRCGIIVSSVFPEYAFDFV